MQQQESLSKSAERPAIHPFALYLMSLAAMIGLYSLYAKFLVPIIIGPAQQVQRRVVTPDIELPTLPFDKTQLARLLPADAWENDGCKTLLTPEGTILFKDFEPVDGGYLEVFPFTLITTSESNRADGADANFDLPQDPKPPTFLRCLQGARLKFDKPLSEVFSGKAKVKSAQLVGHVNIFRPPSSPTVEDGLAISTSNVQIEKHQVFTIEEVSFAIGLHRGSGKNLKIQLAHHTDANEITGDFSSVRGIKRIELAFLDQLRLESSGNKQLLDEDSDAKPSSATDNGDQPFPELDSPISVKCSGPFVFDLASRTATFSDQVVVQMENEFQDQITADLLKILFQEKPSDDIAPVAPVDQPADLVLQKLVAEGSPAVIFSAERATKISAERFSYDAINEYLVAENDASPITIVSPDYHVVARRIRYKQDQPGSLGIIDATGPGKMLRVANAKQKEFLVQWQKKLTVQPEGEQHRIHLTGDAKIRIDRDTGIKSESIQFWINETEIVSAGDDGKIETRKNYQPVKLVAEGTVRLLSPQIDGTTQRLTANWSNHETPVQTGSRRQINSRQLAYAGKINVRRPFYGLQEFHRNQHVSNPNPNGMQSIHKIQNNAAPSKVAQVRFDQEIKKTNKKFSFQGDEVIAKLFFKDGQTEIKDLTVTGNVFIKEVAAQQQPQESVGDETQDRPLNIRGNLLRCIPQSEDKMRLMVAGTPEQPAFVSAKNLELQGRNIHLDQAANKLWVDGAGRIHLKPKEQNAESENASPGGFSAANQNQEVNVSWQGGMIFDGTKLYFEERVAMESRGRNKEGKPVFMSADSAGLSLNFDRTIQFEDLQGDPPNREIKIRETVIVDRLPSGQRIFKLANARTNKPANYETVEPAIITNQTFDSQGQLIEQQQFFVTQATWNADIGTVNSKGPGVFLHYRKGNLTLSGQMTVQSNSPSENLSFPFGKSDALMFIRVNFDGAANANINRSEISVQGNVRTMYAPVETFEQVFDPDQQEGLPLESVKVTCEQLKIAQWTPRNSTEATQELIARGNAHIRSSSFEATADRVSYNRSTDILVVEGTPRSDAHLWFKQTPNARQRDHLVAGKILYRLSDQWTDVQGVRNVNINR